MVDPVGHSAALDRAGIALSERHARTHASDVEGRHDPPAGAHPGGPATTLHGVSPRVQRSPAARSAVAAAAPTAVRGLAPIVSPDAGTGRLSRTLRTATGHRARRDVVALPVDHDQYRVDRRRHWSRT